MSNSYRLRQMAFGLLVALFAISLSSSADAQTSKYKRKVVLEEFTGTWCQYCPIGAEVMDSIQHRMEDWAVEFAWHVGGGDPMEIPPGVQLANKEFGISSYPSIITEREYLWPNYQWSPNIPTYLKAVEDAKKAPDADVRITNVKIVGTKMDFDVEVTPYDVKTMAKEDTCKYALFVGVTEDGVVADQQTVNGEILGDYVHFNVVRAVKTATQGDVFPMGTTTAVNAYPIKKHFSVTSINGEWKQENLRLKAFVSRRSNKQGQFIINADQTPHIGQMPEDAPNAVWTVTPAAGSVIDANKPASIVWSKQGTPAKVKLEYSINDGAKWEPIATDITASPYLWTMPAAVYDQSVVIRISDVADGMVNSVSEAFNVAAPITAQILVTKPASGDQLKVNSTTQIIFETVGEMTNTWNVEYTTNGGTDWVNIVQTTGMTVSWKLPSETAEQAQVRVRSIDGIVGMSGIFSIVPSGTMSGLTVNNGTYPLTKNTPYQIKWTASGETGKFTIESSQDGTIWSEVAADLASNTRSYTWTTPDAVIPAMYLRLSSTGAGQMQIGPFAIEAGTQGAVKLTGIPTSNGIASSYPNPFVSTSSIVYNVATAGDVTLKVSNILGKDVATLESGAHQPGVYSTELNAANLTPGTYVVTMLINGETYSRTVSVTK